MVMNLRQGAEKIKSLYQPEELGLVTITSFYTGLDNHHFLVEKLRDELDLVSFKNNTYSYFPPPNVGHCQSYWLRKMMNIKTLREEQIPKVNPKLTFIIIDDTYETGGTMGAAVKMLVKQGVDKTKLWFSTGMIEHNSMGPFLDNVSNYPKR